MGSRKIPLNDIYNEEQRKRAITWRLRTGLSRKQRAKPRDPAESELLLRAILGETERLKREGLLETNGRKWRLTTTGRN